MATITRFRYGWKSKTWIKVISIKELESIEELIIKSRDEGLEFIVVDEKTELFRDLRQDSEKFEYLEKVFHYDQVMNSNEFSIFRINYDLFDLRTWL